MPLWQFRGSARFDNQRACRLAPAVGVNLTGAVLGTKVSVLALRASGQHSAHGSAIVNLASVAGLVGSSIGRLYSMIKGGGHTVHQVGGARIRPQGLPDPRQLDSIRYDRHRYERSAACATRTQYEHKRP